MLLTIVLAILKICGESKWQSLADGLSELLGESIKIPTFLVYVFMAAIIIDLIILVVGNVSDIYILVGIEGVIIYNWKFLYESLLVGVNECFGRQISVYGYIVLWICITILYFASSAIGNAKS